MHKHYIVCDFDEELISNFNNEAIVVRTTNPLQLDQIGEMVNAKNKLHRILLMMNQPLSSMEFSPFWRKLPIDLYCINFGLFKELVDKLEDIRNLDIRIFFDGGLGHNYRFIHILASLQISCGVYLTQQVDWEKLTDLMLYSFYTKTRTADIEPFRYYKHNYESGKLLVFDNETYQNPLRYLHISRSGKIALTSADLINERFITENLRDFDNITDLETYQEFLNIQQEYFLKPDGCAYCEGWQLCQGRFENQLKHNPGCQAFFAELFEAIDFYLKNNNQKKTGQT